MFLWPPVSCSTKGTGSRCKKKARNTRGRLMFRARYINRQTLNCNGPVWFLMIHFQKFFSLYRKEFCNVRLIVDLIFRQRLNDMSFVHYVSSLAYLLDKSKMLLDHHDGKTKI